MSGTSSLLLTLHTGWGPLGAPTWPEQSTGLERAATAPGEAAPGAGAGRPPDPWCIGRRAALSRSRPDIGGLDVLLLGDTQVEAVLVDFDAGAPVGTDLAQLVRERAFDPEAAFLFGARRWAYYDNGGRGILDLALLDADGDGVAEERWIREEQEAWRKDADVVLPWLSQGYVQQHVTDGGGAGRKVEITARLQVLQRAE